MRLALRPIVPKMDRCSLRDARSPAGRFCIMCVVFVLVASCRKDRPAAGEEGHPRKSTQTAVTRQVRQEVSAIASRHNADYQWKVSADECLFTVEIEDILCSRIGRPLFTLAPVTDVQRQEGQYFVVAQDTLGVSDLFLRLKCSLSQAEHVMNVAKNGGYLGWFAIVFRAESVRRPVWELRAQPDGDAAYIAVNEANEWFVKGECLDLSYVGRDCIDLKDVLNTNESD